MCSARRPPVVSEMSGRRGPRNSGLVVRTPAVATVAEKAVKPVLEAPQSQASVPVTALDASSHDVYATALRDVTDESGVLVARTGERAFVLPDEEAAPGKSP